MKAQSAIDKGKRLEKWLIQQLAEYGIDNNARREAGSGNGLKKGDLLTSFDFLVEAKNQETPAWIQTIDQAKAQAKVGFHNPDKWLAVIRDPRAAEFNAVYAVLDIHQLLNLYKKAMESKIEKPDRTVSYKVRRAKQALQDLLKELE